jgi:hypothetical protein
MRHYRVPPDITGPFATRVGPKDGPWRSHPTNDAARQYLERARDRGDDTSGSLVLLVSSPGRGEPAPELDERPYGWASGQHTMSGVLLRLDDATLARVDESARSLGVTRQEWLRRAVGLALFRPRELSAR